MKNTKPYEPPQLYRVELNPEQAILSSCSLTSTNLVHGGTGSCRGGDCKQHNGNGVGDNSARAS